MSVNQGVNQYQQINNNEAIAGVTPHRLVQMLMEGALQRMAEAKGAMVRNDLNTKGIALGKAISIIGGLRDSLNMEAEGDLSVKLDTLYEYMVHTLFTANVSNQSDKVDEVTELMKSIKSGWDGIASKVA